MVCGLGFGGLVWGFRFGVRGFGSMVYGVGGARGDTGEIKGLGFRVWGLESRLQGLGRAVERSFPVKR